MEPHRDLLLEGQPVGMYLSEVDVGLTLQFWSVQSLVPLGVVRLSGVSRGGFASKV